MIHTEVQTRPDMDIEEDINAVLRNFSPLKAARRYFKVQSTNGNVKVSGNSGSPQAKHVLLDYIKKTRGVINVDMTTFYDDEDIRLNIGGMVPDGIRVNVQFGSVVLDSKLPNGDQEILRRVQSAAGIRQVVMSDRRVEIN